jgi:hypothetical protein
MCSMVKSCNYDNLPNGRYCYWHRLLRCRKTDQGEEARRRAENPRTDGDATCKSCGPVAAFYMVPRRRLCVGCHYNESRARAVASTYGLSSESHENLRTLQNNRCAICGRRQNMQDLAVDHDHRTGAVRGLLCYSCNHELLGSAHDAPMLLIKALIYLLRPPTSGRWTCSPDLVMLVMNTITEHNRDDRTN